MKNGTLIIFSGLPGSGKSTLAAKLASHLGATYVRIDTIEQGLREICDISEIEGRGYRLAYRIAQENLRIGNTVIADSVNPWKLTRNEWNDVARAVGAHYINIEIICADKDEHKGRIETRRPTVQGLKVTTWKDVLERDYHAWEQERTVIDTSGKSEDTSFAELLTVLAKGGD